MSLAGQTWLLRNDTSAATAPSARRAAAWRPRSVTDVVRAVGIKFVVRIPFQVVTSTRR
jgi:hypothetical protein